MAKTVEQIANALNLSITTVRLVLNGKARQYRISDKTQARITRYVAEHGYSVNHTARSLKLNKTETLGLIVPRLSNLFFSTLAEKLEMRCREAGYQLMISCTYSDALYENKLVEAQLQRNVDGLFVVPCSPQSLEHHLRRIKRPLVLLDRDFAAPDVPLIVSDNFNGGRQLAEAMRAACGSAPLFFMAGDSEQPAIRERLRGYQSVVGEASQHWILRADHNRHEDGERMMRQFFLQQSQAPRAFIASSLPVLEGGLSVLRERCGAIPADINIGTFDEHGMLGFLANNIWSMRQNEDAWVDRAFSAMQRALHGETSVPGAVIPMTMIRRQRANGTASA
ncbi:substrate-binding domain-containing protein [Affinibrenneria salicis]|uniref:Substrate-binding domain-containing protein n=1 Tax=Affinibrenneria salicis TaxID=2590031 RepID=A0A5J5FZ93_9GAMM|nr:LacI family DNA-binding transcriptional regulator [Affinibrenneria salicis]KAA8998477.1 substrate-binding domain-containing protein [Affinibrenneria salicis]